MTLIPMCPDKEVEEKNKSKKLSHADVISFPIVFSIAGENVLSKPKSFWCIPASAEAPTWILGKKIGREDYSGQGLYPF